MGQKLSMTSEVNLLPDNPGMVSHLKLDKEHTIYEDPTTEFH